MNFGKYADTIEAWMPEEGEGENMAEQIVTAVNKIIYRWYNDGDVFDNTGHLGGWENDLSSYANWLQENAEGTARILYGIYGCKTEEDYEALLEDLAELTLNNTYLERYGIRQKYGSIYECAGPFKFDEWDEEEDEEDEWDEEE